jgi:hypothetical protein
MKITQRAPKKAMTPVKMMPSVMPLMISRRRFAPFELVHHIVHAHVDAGTHAVGGAELGHPDEQVDGEFRGPGETRTHEVTHHHGDEGHEGGRGHEAQDEPLLEAIENAVEHGASPVRVETRPGMRRGGLR